MSRRNRILSYVAMLGLLPATGCVLASDLLNADFAGLFGLNLASQGTNIIVFQNHTDYVAVFYAYEIGTLGDPPLNARNFDAEVPAGETRNEVLDCPVDAVSLGVLDDSFAATPLGAIVYSGETAVEVTYAGSALYAGSEYNCGDVIVAQLLQIGTTDAAAFQLRIEVLPGR